MPRTELVPITAAASLFRAGLRTRRGPRGHTESEYSFLNESAREPIARIWQVLNGWFARLTTDGGPRVGAVHAQNEPVWGRDPGAANGRDSEDGTFR